MNGLVDSTALILVSVMNKARDLEIARLLGWYRIPLRSAPKVVAVDYLAFYQTGAFNQDKWRIQYLAPVFGHELVKRIELLQDEPHHPQAQQDYYKVQIGPLKQLAEPIVAEDWRRITFFYTTGELLKQAKTIRDLIVPSDERAYLWQTLHERANRTQCYNPTPLPEIDLAPEILSALLGIKEIENAYNPPQRESRNDA